MWKKVLTLSKEQARTLYNLLSNHEIPTSIESRKRFKFLEVFEDFAFAYDDDIKEFQGKPLTPEIQEKIEKLGKETKKITFSNREVYSSIEVMIKECFETGGIDIGPNGQRVRKPLTGRDAKVYMEIEDAFDTADGGEQKGSKEK